MPLLSCYVYTVCELLKVARPWLHLGEITVLACWGGGLQPKIPRCYLFVLEVTWSPAVVVALTEWPTWRKRAARPFSPHMHQARMLELHTQAASGRAAHLFGLRRGSFFLLSCWHLKNCLQHTRTCCVGNSRAWSLKDSGPDWGIFRFILTLLSWNENAWSVLLWMIHPSTVCFFFFFNV